MSSNSVSVSLQSRLAALRAERGGNVAIDEVGDVVTSLVSTLQGDFEATTLRFSAEIERLMEFITTAKEEIASINPNTLSKRDLPGAADELDAIVAATEDAAGKIMDAADEVQAIAAGLDGALGDKLLAVSTKIFEASSFQDITGQRVTKVVRVLKLVEERLALLAQTIGDDHIEEKAAIERDKDGVVVKDEDLLHGPQLEGDGNNQDDIDALLASFD
ncbi:MAG: protein phosphatase CheZ [Pseudomonadota bacterium]